MSGFKIFILILGLSTQVLAVNYSNQQLQNMIDDRVNMQASDFVRGYFTTENPQRYLNDFLSLKEHSDDNIIIKEYQLFTLLNEIAQYPQLPFLLDAVNALKAYEIQSFKLHEEGRLHVPVFDIKNKALGIENIWLAQKSHNHYLQAFNDAPVKTLLSLKFKLQGLERPVWEGLKKSIKDLTQTSQQKISDFLSHDHENMIGLDRFISRYVFMVGDQELAKAALTYVDKSAGQYILRYISQHFSEGFVIEMLIESLAQKKHQRFAISMLAEFVDSSDTVSELLINMLSDKNYASQAGFALAQTKQPKVMYELYQRFNASKSALEKKNIVYVLKLSKHHEAKVLLDRIDSKQLDKSTRLWLSHFAGALQ